MRIRRIRIILPARLKASAARDGRAIAEAAAGALAGGGRPPAGPVLIDGAARTAQGLAMETASRLAPRTGGSR
jgi:hypothetical protein